MVAKLTLEHYQTLAQEKNLNLLFDELPANTRQFVDWQCRDCGRIHRRSYWLTKYASGKGCICRSGKTIDWYKIADLCHLWDIQLVDATRLPKNNRDPVRWRNRYNEIFTATYLELAYRPSKRILRILQGE